MAQQFIWEETASSSSESEPSEDKASNSCFLYFNFSCFEAEDEGVLILLQFFSGVFKVGWLGPVFAMGFDLRE